MLSVELILKNVPDDWKEILYRGNRKTLLDSVIQSLSDVPIDKFAPKPDEWFAWTQTELKGARVIIIGQDPYPTKGDAHGLSFSCLGRVPPSLQNIYKCWKNSGLIKDIPKTGNLSYLAMQGVILMNVAMSTIVGTSKSHSSIWEPYTDAVIMRLNKLKPLIALLWGNAAGGYGNLLKKYTVMKWIHPSPMAQTRAPPEKKFINCDHFTETNNILKNAGIQPIIWGIKEYQEGKSIDNINYIPVPAKIEPPNNTPQCVLNIKSDMHIAFTDGSSWPNNKSAKSRGGFATLFVSGEYKDVGVMGNLKINKHFASNIRAEGDAIYIALKMIYKSDKWQSAYIITDSKFWVDMIYKFMPSWDNNAFRKKSNPDMTKKIWKLWEKVSQQGDANIIHMYAHNRKGWASFPADSAEKICYDYNDIVDKRCGQARIEMNPGQTIIFEI
jgi:uracil-DNA glycosylase